MLRIPIRISFPDLELLKIHPIRVIDHSINATWVLPSLDYKEIIPTLWAILVQIVDDWHRISNEYQFPQDNLERSLSYIMTSFEDIKPRYIQCLFPYINS